MSPRPRVKICCLKSVAEARAAIAHGVDERLIPEIAAAWATVRPWGFDICSGR